MALDPRIEAVRVQYGLDKSDFWELPMKKGTWLAKHSALEAAAVKASIRFDMPQILEADGANGVCAVCVQGAMADRFEWSIGEASPKNNRNAYPWAMAEKRAKDRVILKLIGLHGLVYSEDEADDFKEPRNQPSETRDLPATAPAFASSEPKAKSRFLFDDMMKKLRAAGNAGRKELRTFYTSAEFIECWEIIPADWRKELEAEKDAFLASYPTKVVTGTDPNETLDRQYADTMGARQ